MLTHTVYQLREARLHMCEELSFSEIDELLVGLESLSAAAIVDLLDQGLRGVLGKANPDHCKFAWLYDYFKSTDAAIDSKLFPMFRVSHASIIPLLISSKVSAITYKFGLHLFFKLRTSEDAADEVAKMMLASPYPAAFAGQLIGSMREDPARLHGVLVAAIKEHQSAL